MAGETRGNPEVLRKKERFGRRWESWWRNEGEGRATGLRRQHIVSTENRASNYHWEIRPCLESGAQGQAHSSRISGVGVGKCRSAGGRVLRK